jgi:hypothetical protein
MMFEFVEPQWNNIDRGKPKNLEEYMFQCHSVHHNSYVD